MKTFIYKPILDI